MWGRCCGGKALRFGYFESFNLTEVVAPFGKVGLDEILYGGMKGKNSGLIILRSEAH